MKICPLWAALLGGLITLGSGCTETGTQNAATSPVTIEKSPSDNRQYRYLQLDNKMKVMLVADNDIDVTAAALSVDAGSYQDPPEYPGLAHYTEHMLFMGTEQFPEPGGFQTFTKNNAGFTNAFTSFNQTLYMFQVPADKADPALTRFSDYFKAPLFDKNYSQKERDAVHNEWSMRRENDRRILARLSGLNTSEGHPARQFMIGNRKTLPSIDDSGLYQAMRDFYQRYYSANLMTLTLVSGHSLDEQEQLVRQYFGGVPNRDAERPVITQKAMGADQQGKHLYYQPRKEMRSLWLDFPIDDNTDQWRQKPNAYLIRLIRSEEPGTLAHYLREQNLANKVTAAATSDYYGADGALTIRVDLTEPGWQSRDRVISATLAYLDLIRREGVSRELFDESRRLARINFNNQSKRQPVGQAVHTARMLQDVPPEVVNSFGVHYDDYAPEAIRAVLAQLQPQHMRLWHIGPDVPVDTPIAHYPGQYGVAAITDKELSKWQSGRNSIDLQLPERNDLAGESSREVGNTIERMTKLVDADGAKLWLRHSEHYPGSKGLTRWELNSPIGQESTEQFVLGCFLNGLLTDATTSLRDRAGNAGLSITIDRTPDNKQYIQLTGPSGKHPQLIRQMLDTLTTMEITAENIARERDGFDRWIRGESKDRPVTQAFRQLNRQTRSLPWDSKAILRASSEVTVEAVERYRRELLRTAVLRVYAFGHYDGKAMTKLVREQASALHDEREPGEMTFPAADRPQPGQHWNLTHPAEHNDVALAQMFVSEGPSLQTHARLMVLNALMSQAMFKELRTEQQLGYVVGSTPHLLNRTPSVAFFLQSSDYDLSTLKDRLENFQGEYLTTLEQTAPAQFTQTRDGILKQMRQKPNNFYREASRPLGHFTQGEERFDYLDRLEDAVASVDKAAVVATYKALVLAKNTPTILSQIKGTGFSDSEYATP